MINVKYISSSKSPSGYGSAARQFVTALFCSGVNVTTENLMQMAESTNYGITGDITDNLQGRNIPYKISIVHLTPDLIPTFQEKGIFTIAHLFWEMDTLPKDWIEPLNNIDEIWTASLQMKEMIQKSGIQTPIYYFSQPIFTGRAVEKIEPFMFSFPKDFTFYAIGQWIDRKNFKGLLRAYWKAFEKEDKVSLLIKSYRMNYSEMEYELIKKDILNWKWELKQQQFPKILLTKNLFSEDQIAKLHMLGDCYVNPSSGEGWCRPMQEAMLYGKPVISGDNGGITDIMTNQYYNVVPSTLQNATEASHIPWYKDFMHWKVIDEDVLGKQMRYVYENYTQALEKAKKAQKFVVDEFSFTKIGEQMRLRLEEISKQL